MLEVFVNNVFGVWFFNFFYMMKENMLIFLYFFLLFYFVESFIVYGLIVLKISCIFFIFMEILWSFLSLLFYKMLW